MMSKLEKIMAQVDERQDELVSLLAKLISFKPPGPPARNTAEAQTYVAQYLESLGFSIDMWEVYPNDPNVVGVHKGIKSDKYQSLILNGHIDVAEVRPGGKLGDRPIQSCHSERLHYWSWSGGYERRTSWCIIRLKVVKGRKYASLR